MNNDAKDIWELYLESGIFTPRNLEKLRDTDTRDLNDEQIALVNQVIAEVENELRKMGKLPELPVGFRRKILSKVSGLKTNISNRLSSIKHPRH